MSTSFTSAVVSFKNLLRKLEVKRETETDVHAYIQRDTISLPPSRRTYGPWNFVGLWVVTGSFNVGGWTTGSSLISLGLDMWQAMLVVIIANVFAGFLCVLGGAPGAKWHVEFPLIQRSVWGMRGGYFPLANRVFLFFVWISTNTWYGGQCVKVFLTALWPSFATLNHSLAGGTMVTADFVAFVVFIALCLPLMWVNPERYRIPFMIAAISVVPTVFVLMIWSTIRVGGGGMIVSNASAVPGVKQATGSALGWAFVSGITANIGGIATHMFSQAAYTRYARKPKDQILAQVVTVPLGSITVALIVAFAAVAFTFSEFGIVVASNAVVAGIDLAGLFPRYFTVRRGGCFTMCFAFVMQPWQLLNSATSFLTVVGRYAVFLGPFMGIMSADYFLLRHQNLKLTALYEMSPKSIYWYSHGFNWRAAAAWIPGVAILLPGFIHKVGAPKNVLEGWTHLYWMAWFIGCLVSGALYYAFDFISPVAYKGEVDDEDYFGTFSELELPTLYGVELPRSVSPQSVFEPGAKKTLRSRVTAV